MKKLVAALLMLPLLPLTYSMATAQNAPTGDVAAGKALWADELRCKDCHGGVAEGAFGPDLAGRGLNYSQVRQAVRKPWGIMPMFTDLQVSDRSSPIWPPISAACRRLRSRVRGKRKSPPMHLPDSG